MTTNDPPAVEPSQTRTIVDRPTRRSVLQGAGLAALAAIVFGLLAYAAGNRGRERVRAGEDRVTFGADARVAQGETVRDLVVMGGDARVEGTVTGDVTAMGGDVEVVPGAVVRGHATSLGGEVRVMPGALVQGEQRSRSSGAWRMSPFGLGARSWASRALADAARFSLLFLFGLLLLAAVPERFLTAQEGLERAPGRSLGAGVLGALAALLVTLAMAITIIGIPGAILVAFATMLGLWAGMALGAAAIVRSAHLSGLATRPVARLALGFAVLYLISRVPFLGTLVVALVAIAGLGSVISTRLGRTLPGARERAREIERAPLEHAPA